MRKQLHEIANDISYATAVIQQQQSVNPSDINWRPGRFRNRDLIFCTHGGMTYYVYIDGCDIPFCESDPISIVEISRGDLSHKFIISPTSSNTNITPDKKYDMDAATDEHRKYTSLNQIRARLDELTALRSKV